MAVLNNRVNNPIIPNLNEGIDEVGVEQDKVEGNLEIKARFVPQFGGEVTSENGVWVSRSRIKLTLELETNQAIHSLNALRSYVNTEQAIETITEGVIWVMERDFTGKAPEDASTPLPELVN